MAGIGEQTADDFGRTAANVRDAATDAKNVASDVKNRVSDVVSDMSQSATDSARRLARQTAASVERGADYFRNNGVQQIAEDLKDYAKANPTQALVGAAVVGFCLGRMMSRD
jgi:ElaB/YqjD/DUF883 family membrane-anchored ribosome-binding protein